MGTKGKDEVWAEGQVHHLPGPFTEGESSVLLKPGPVCVWLDGFRGETKTGSQLLPRQAALDNDRFENGVVSVTLKRWDRLYVQCFPRAFPLERV